MSKKYEITVSTNKRTYSSCELNIGGNVDADSADGAVEAFWLALRDKASDNGHELDITDNRACEIDKEDGWEDDEYYIIDSAVAAEIIIPEYYPITRDVNSWSERTRDDGTPYRIYGRVRSCANVATDIIGNSGDYANNLTADQAEYWTDYISALDDYDAALMDAEDRITAADAWTEKRGGAYNAELQKVLDRLPEIEDADGYRWMVLQLATVCTDPKAAYNS